MSGKVSLFDMGNWLGRMERLLGRKPKSFGQVLDEGYGRPMTMGDVLSKMTASADALPPEHPTGKFSGICTVGSVVNDGKAFLMHDKMAIYSYQDNCWYELEWAIPHGGLAPSQNRIQPTHWRLINEPSIKEGIAAKVAGLIEDQDDDFWPLHIAKILEHVAETDDLDILRMGQEADILEAGFKEFLADLSPLLDVPTIEKGGHYKFAKLLAGMDRQARATTLKNFAQILRDRVAAGKEAQQ